MKIGFVGCGNMASAMIEGILRKGLCAREEIIASNRTEEGNKRSQERLGICVTRDNCKVVKEANTIVIAVKPQYYEEVIKEIRDLVTGKHVIISIAPGKTLAWLEEKFGKPVKIVRTMPNTPALVGEGMTGACANSYVKEVELAGVQAILSSFVKYEMVPESLMDVVVSVSGSSPAYVFMFIEAMADAAVADGMPRAQAYEFAAQAVLGSAKMVLETGKHPGELKDMVCSPGGTTIEAVRQLEKSGFRSSVIEAMKACAAISRKM